MSLKESLSNKQSQPPKKLKNPSFQAISKELRSRLIWASVWKRIKKTQRAAIAQRTKSPHMPMYPLAPSSVLIAPIFTKKISRCFKVTSNRSILNAGTPIRLLAYKWAATKNSTISLLSMIKLTAKLRGSMVAHLRSSTGAVFVPRSGTSPLLIE